MPRRHRGFGISVGHRVEQVMARRIGVTLDDCDAPWHYL